MWKKVLIGVVVLMAIASPVGLALAVGAGVGMIGGVASLAGAAGGYQADSATGSCNTTGGGPGGPQGTVVPVSQAEVANVRIIVGIGKARNVAQPGWVVAVAVALQESSLKVLANPSVPASLALPNQGLGSDHDSLGVFQQRPSAGWGTVAQLMDPNYDAEAFYGGVTSDSALNKGLLNVPGWQSLPLAVAAQKVQISADGSAYAKWEATATQLVTANADAPSITLPVAPGTSGSAPGPAGGGSAPGGSSGGSCTGAGPTGATGSAAAVIAAAKTQLGIPYSWGGGTDNGPSYGIAQGAGINGFDCSGITMYAYWQGAHIQIQHYTGSQFPATANHPSISQIQPGDLLFYWGTQANPDHVVMFIGNNQVIQAPQTGQNVEIVPLWTQGLVGITRILGP